MTFTRELLERSCARLHRAGELAHLEIGITMPQLLLITPTLTATAILLPGGIPATASTALLRRRAAAIGAVAAAYTVEVWGEASSPSHRRDSHA